MYIISFLFSTGIIKEEELERIDQIVNKEDGWVQDDEIDYNQKLVFSDDDSDGVTTSRKDAKRVNFNDKEARAHELEMRAGKFAETQKLNSFRGKLPAILSNSFENLQF